MDTFLTIASRREVRDYRPEPIPEDIVERILDAGRITGSAKNKQPWRLLLIRDRDKLDALAQVINRASNLEGAPLAVAVVLADDGKPFDAGRAAQNMMLAAWNDGVGCCPNTVKDPEKFQELTGDTEGHPTILLSFGFPEKKISPERRPAEEWVARADRKPRAEVVREIDS